MIACRANNEKGFKGRCCMIKIVKIPNVQPPRIAISRFTLPECLKQFTRDSNQDPIK